MPDKDQNLPKASCSQHTPPRNDLSTISKVDQLVEISDSEERTDEEAVKNSFANILGAVMLSRSTDACPTLNISLSRRDERISIQLGAIGDKIDRMFGSDIENLLNSFSFDEQPFDILWKIYEGLFANGCFTWGRIIAFLMFGIKLYFRYAAKSLFEGLHSLWKNVLESLGAILSERIFEWIANHGGWDRIVASNYQLALGTGATYWISFGLFAAGGFVLLFLRFCRPTI